MGPLKQKIIYALERDFGKLFLATVVLGFTLGLGMVLGRWVWPRETAMLVKNCPQSLQEALHENDETYEKIKENIRLTYYSELLKAPEQVAPMAPPEETQEEEKAPPVLKEELAQEKPPSSDKIAKALVKVLGNETPETVKQVAKAGFVIQVASLPESKAANQLVATLKAKGVQAKIILAQVEGKGRMYRVRVYGFKTRDEAEAFAKKKLGPLSLKAMVVSE